MRGRARLPAQTLLHTEWFHADCLASYYGVAPLSEEHWRILENFIRAAGRSTASICCSRPCSRRRWTPP
ncbi:MAG: glycoside hydrolase domain-containing protein [Ruthenibacterium lactatiformans]